MGREDERLGFRDLKYDIDRVRESQRAAPRQHDPPAAPPPPAAAAAAAAPTTTTSAAQTGEFDFVDNKSVNVSLSEASFEVKGGVEATAESTALSAVDQARLRKATPLAPTIKRRRSLRPDEETGVTRRHSVQPDDDAAARRLSVQPNDDAYVEPAELDDYVELADVFGYQKPARITRRERKDDNETSGASEGGAAAAKPAAKGRWSRLRGSVMSGVFGNIKRVSTKLKRRSSQSLLPTTEPVATTPPSLAPTEQRRMSDAESTATNMAKRMSESVLAAAIDSALVAIMRGDTPVPPDSTATASTSPRQVRFADGNGPPPLDANSRHVRSISDTLRESSASPSSSAPLPAKVDTSVVGDRSAGGGAKKEAKRPMDAQDHLMARLNWQEGVNRARESMRPGEAGGVVGRAQKAPNKLPFHVSLRKVGLPQEQTTRAPAPRPTSTLDELPEECVTSSPPFVFQIVRGLRWVVVVAAAVVVLVVVVLCT
jgi:hypothetical protein